MKKIQPVMTTMGHGALDRSGVDVGRPRGWVVAGSPLSTAGQLNPVERLRYSEQRLADFLDTAADRLWEMDADLRLVFVSQGQQDTMLAPELVLGKTRWEVAGVEPDCDEHWRAHVADLHARRPFRDFKFKIVGPDGKAYHHSVSGIPMFDHDGRFLGYRGTVRDVTDLTEAHRRIEHLAFHDDLTGLPNRRALDERLKCLGARLAQDGMESRIGVMLLDIDHFKDINDTLGHSLGDRLLKDVANRLRHNIDKDDMVTRIGGDEFAIVAASTWRKVQLDRMAARIIDVMAEPFIINGTDVRIGVSIGITVYPDHGTDFERTLANADMALYAAKNAGRNTWHTFDDRLHRKVQRRHQLDQDLRRAWQRGEFALHYQPLICLAKARVAGFEALIRWQHREHGCLLPDCFLSTLELSPFIEPLTRWTLMEALREQRRWQKKGLGDLQIAVNVPTVALRGTGLIRMVNDCLAEIGTDADMLVLEISERALIDEATVVPVLNALRRQGVTIAIDDFGTGYSSLARLKSLPVDIIKIDRSFLADIGEGPEEAAIAELLIKIGHSLGKKVVVEGVESQAQITFLDAIGCVQVQGFLFSPALSPADLPRWLSSWRNRPIDERMGRSPLLMEVS